MRIVAVWHTDYNGWSTPVLLVVIMIVCVQVRWILSGLVQVFNTAIHHWGVQCGSEHPPLCLAPRASSLLRDCSLVNTSMCISSLGHGTQPVQTSLWQSPKAVSSNILWADRGNRVEWIRRVKVLVVLLRFQKFCCRSVSVGFARKTAVFGLVSVFVCPVFPLSSMWYVYAAHCTSNLQQYITYFCV